MLSAGLVVGVVATTVACMPFSQNLFGPAKVLMITIGLLLVSLGAAGAVSEILPWLRALIRRPWAMAVLACCGVGVLASAVSEHPMRSLAGSYPEYSGLWLVFASSVFLGVTVLLRESGYEPMLHRWMLIGLLVVLSYALLQALGLDPIAYRESLVEERLRSTLGNASNLGVYLLLVVPPIVYWLWAEMGQRLVAVALIVACAFVLVRTESRGALLGAGVAVLAMTSIAIVKRRSRGERSGRVRQGRLVPVMIGVVVVVAVIATTPGMLERLENVSPTSADAQWRFSLWRSSVEMFADRPVLGWGPSSFSYVFPQYREPMLSETGGSSHVLSNAHNVMLDVVVSSGVAGLAAVMALAAAIAVQWKTVLSRSRARALALGGSLLAAAIALQFHFITLDLGPLLGLTAGMLVDVPAYTPRSNARGRVPRLVRFIPASVCAVAVVMAVAIILADTAVAAGFASVNQGDDWAAAVSSFELAQRIAPWEPAFRWAEGKAATQHIVDSRSGAALADGTQAFEVAVRRLPPEPLLLRDRADLQSAAGMLSEDRAVLERALGYYVEATLRDPFNAPPLIGQGATLLALGRDEEAAEVLEQAVSVAPASAIGWHDLAVAYDRVGRRAEAEAALRKAENPPRL